jgi:hypothetical protein
MDKLVRPWREAYLRVIGGAAEKFSVSSRFSSDCDAPSIGVLV